MYQSNSQQPTHLPNMPYQQLQSHQTSRPFSQQQFGPRFQTPPQQFTPSRPFYQPSRPLHGPVQPQYQGPAQPPQFCHSSNTNFDPTPNSIYQPPLQNFESSPKPPYQLPIQNFKTQPTPHYPPPSVGPDFNQMLIPPYRTPRPMYEPPVQNYNQPPPIQNYQPPPVQNYNQPPPIQNFNNHPPIQNHNQPPIQNYNHPVSSYQPANQNCHQLMSSPSPGYNSTPNTSYQPQIQSPESLKKPYQLPENRCYGQQQSSFNVHRPEFNQRPPFRQRFPFNNHNPRHHQLQLDNNRFQFHPRQPYQSHRPRGPHTNFINQPKGNNVPKKDKLQISCDMGDCDFVGHASAVKEHQNMHHRLGLHKKVLYSNNSDAIKNWIEERKKKWPTKETIKIKSEVEEEKNKRGERIVDEDFHRFNKNNKFNHSGSKRFNNRKRPRCNGEFIEPAEEPMNGKLKRFAGITVVKEEEIHDEIYKPVALKLLEEYDVSNDSQSDNEPPEETAIVKKSALPDNKNLAKPIEEQCSTSEIRAGLIENNKDVDITIIEAESGSISTEVKIDENLPKVNEACENTNTERGIKRKKTPKKESKPIKKPPPLRTPRTEIVERKGALLEALMGDLMRSERNTITQCICYIRNNMHRFCKIQAA